MSKGYVKNNIIDGSLGAMPAPATGIFGAIGVCAEPTDGILILTDAAVAHERLVAGPLRDLVVQALSMAATTCYCVGVEGTTPGSVSTVSHSGAGTGTMTVTGAPRNDYDCQVRVVQAGGLNAAVVVVTVDGVPGRRTTIPTNGEIEIQHTGLKLHFAASAEQSYSEGDIYSFETTAPQASNAELLDAVDLLLESKYAYEWISVAGVSDQTLWAALATKAAEAEASYRYIHFKAQARYLDEGESVDQWVAALTGAERGTTVGGRVQVCAGWALGADPMGEVDRRGGLAWATGLSATRDIHEPVDHVGSSALTGIVALLPEGLNDGHIDALDNAGYLTLCQYIGRSGAYITHGRMFAEDTSDYKLEERRRVMDFACGAVRTAQLNYINSTVELAADGSAAGLEMFKAITENVLRDMQSRGRISGFSVEIDPEQDLLATETLTTRIRIIPLGKMTYIENVISYHNPKLAN